MNNIILEKLIYKDLQSKGYDLYCSKSYKNQTYKPQLFAIHSSVATKQLLRQAELKLAAFTTQKIHNTLHQRPLIIVKSFTGRTPVHDNALLFSILKSAITQIPSKDVANSLEKYLQNTLTLSLVENVFSTSQEKVSYFKSFSKNTSLKSANFKNFDLFLNKHCSIQEKEEVLFWFISKRSKELKDINVDKKITNYLLENWKNDDPYLQQFVPFSPYLSNTIQQKDLDVFDSYPYSVSVSVDILKASTILGFTTTKISSSSEKLFKEIEKYHNAHLKIIRENDKMTFLLQHDDAILTQDYLKDLYKRFLSEILKNNVQKVDNPYCEKWYLHDILLKKLPPTNHITKVNKI